MPILPNEARIEDYAPLFGEVVPRIEAGIQFLKEQGINELAIAGHSLGATMASYYLAENDRPIKSFVSIGMAAGSKDPRMDNAASFQRISISMLDLYGSRDQDDVISASSARAAAAQKAGNKAYKQIQVEGADHFFEGKEDELVNTVNNWLAEGG
jgi:alpha/beta superfamily hydrolase